MRTQKVWNFELNDADMQKLWSIPQQRLFDFLAMWVSFLLVTKCASCSYKADNPNYPFHDEFWLGKL